MAAVAIEATPPFRVVGLTPMPIYMPEQRVNGDWTLKIVFPMGVCGAVPTGSCRPD